MCIRDRFHPDRMAARILGMGDVLSLIEKAQESFDMEQAKKLEEKLRKNEFTLNDFLDQMAQIRNMGGAEQIMSMMPGMGKMKVPNQELDQKRMARMEAVVRSMTEQERLRPEIINASRKRRIARGLSLIHLSAALTAISFIITSVWSTWETRYSS